MLRPIHRFLSFVLSASAATLLVTAAATGQLEKVGYFPTSFPNPTSNGSANLTVQVHYPATAAGLSAPLKKTTGGWPVLVFLHGLGGRASAYASVANFVAARGYVVILCDTGTFNTDVEAADGVALYSAVGSENSRNNGFFQGALDPQRVGLAGHSMGGGNTVRVLAANAGYLAGVALAPWDHRLVSRDYPASYSGKVTVPLAIVFGQGDTVLSWTQGQRFYDLAKAYRQLKTFYLFDGTGNHSNVAGHQIANANDQAVFERTMALLVGFMDSYVKDDASGLEEVLGRTARSETRLASLQHQIGATELWLTGDTSLGGTFRMHAMASPGPTALAMGMRSAPVNTVFGPLVLNGAAILILNQASANNECLQSTTLQIPNNPAWKGLSATFQALGGNTAGALRFTGGVDVRVQ